MKEFHIYNHTIFDVDVLSNSLLSYIKIFEQIYKGPYPSDVLKAITTFILNYTLYDTEHIEEYLTDYDYDHQELKEFYDDGELTLNILYFKKIAFQDLEDELLQVLIEYGTIKDIFHKYTKEEVTNIFEELLAFIAKISEIKYDFKNNEIDDKIILKRSYVYAGINNRS